MIIFWFIFVAMASLIIGVVIGVNLGVKYYREIKPDNYKESNKN